MPAMKTLLICPAIRPAVPQLAEEGPLVTASILGECLVNHWLEHLAMLGARHVKIIVADRPQHVRAVVGDGARWGLKAEVIEVNGEPTPAEAAARYRQAGDTDWLPAPYDVVLLSHLPGCRELPLFESYANWFAGLLAWMPRAITPARVRVSEILPGIWVGRRARVAPTAVLTAPCWIGDQVFIEPRAVVGPGAVIEDRAVVESDARVTQSWVGPDTFVGRMTSVTNSLAWGSTLTNWQTDSSLRVPDPFLLCSLAHPQPASADARPSRALGAPARAGESPLNWIAAWHAQPANPDGPKLPGRAADQLL
jgi:hypothetical protein